jgi:hypothetical protein
MIREHTQQPRLPDHAATLKRAAALVGGYTELAARLKVSQQQLDYWIGEIDTLPRTVFLDAIGIIIDNAGALKASPGLEPQRHDGGAQRALDLQHGRNAIGNPRQPAEQSSASHQMRRLSGMKTLRAVPR